MASRVPHLTPGDLPPPYSVIPQEAVSACRRQGGECAWKITAWKIISVVSACLLAAVAMLILPLPANLLVAAALAVGEVFLFDYIGSGRCGNFVDIFSRRSVSNSSLQARPVLPRVIMTPATPTEFTTVQDLPSPPGTQTPLRGQRSSEPITVRPVVGNRNAQHHQDTPFRPARGRGTPRTRATYSPALRAFVRDAPLTPAFEDPFDNPLFGVRTPPHSVTFGFAQPAAGQDLFGSPLSSDRTTTVVQDLPPPGRSASSDMSSRRVAGNRRV
jgi:hypothetical protein